MRFRLAIVPAVIALAAALSPPAQARAADEVVAHDTLIRSIYPLDGDFVYSRPLLLTREEHPPRVWMASFGGRLHPARGIPPEAYAGDIGRDRKGRKVFTFAVERQKGGAFSSKWFVYDLASNRTRRLDGLPRDCFVGWAALWRGRMAYTARCKTRARTGLFVRQGKHRQRLQEDWGGETPVLRGGTIAARFD